MSVSMRPPQPAIPAASRIELGLNENTVLLFGVLVLLVGAAFWSARGLNTEKTDFSTMYVGARMILQGNGASLYDLGEQTRLRALLYTRAEPLIYKHPPFEALVLAPLPHSLTARRI